LMISHDFAIVLSHFHFIGDTSSSLTSVKLLPMFEMIEELRKILV